MTFNPQVGDGVTLVMYSDREAYTVIKRTKCTLQVQKDNAELLNGMNSNVKDKLQVSAGGFVGHVSGSQRYVYNRDENGEIEHFTLRKNGSWMLKGQKFGKLIEGRHEHYDYNF